MEIKNDKTSKWFEVENVPESYMFSHENRPRNPDVTVCDSVPVIDLAKDIQPLEAILTASQEFGFFHVINHGVPEKTMIDAMNVLKEFFDMPSKEAASHAPNKKGWIYVKSDYTKDDAHLWRENLKHLCHPLKDCIPLWPEKPARYQEVIGAYIVEIQKLSLKILEMISEGLGLDPKYFNDISETQILTSNFYPPCPNPSLTLGIPAHKDPSLITIVYQGNSAGLQVLKDGQWINVGAVPNSFVVNIGNQLETISNGKLTSAYHQAVTSADKARISLAAFVNPPYDYIVEPAKALVNESEPSHYQANRFGDFAHQFGKQIVELQNAMISES